MSKTITEMLIIILGSASALFANDADIGYSGTKDAIYSDQPSNYYWDDQTVTAEKRLFSHVTIKETEDKFVVTFHRVDKGEESVE